MRINLIKPCCDRDYLVVEDFKIDQKTKGNAILVTYQNRELIIPLANISCIEEK